MYTANEKDPAARSLGARRGAARAKAMTPEQRAEIVKKAVKGRAMVEPSPPQQFRW